MTVTHTDFTTTPLFNTNNSSTEVYHTHTWDYGDLHGYNPIFIMFLILVCISALMMFFCVIHEAILMDHYDVHKADEDCINIDKIGRSAGIGSLKIRSYRTDGEEFYQYALKILALIFDSYHKNQQNTYVRIKPRDIALILGFRTPYKSNTVLGGNIIINKIPLHTSPNSCQTWNVVNTVPWQPNSFQDLRNATHQDPHVFEAVIQTTLPAASD